MEDDVELSLTQAHEKWLVKMGLVCLIAVLGAAAFCLHDCNATQEAGCTDTVINPAYTTNGVIKCPNPRQTLTFPPGWAWAKCTCPESTPPAPK